VVSRQPPRIWMPGRSASRRCPAAAAALAMERAAELSLDQADRARRLAAAASMAVPTGQADWVQDLASRALAVTADPLLRMTARHDAGWALAYAGQRSPAREALISVAEEAARDQPALAWDALADAAILVYHSGATACRRAVSRVLGFVAGQQAPSVSQQPHRLFRRSALLSLAAPRIWSAVTCRIPPCILTPHHVA
jgi:hypothetical protein